MSSKSDETPLDRVDHLVLATRDIQSTVADFERRLGVRASPGGQHLGRGTRNALIALGPKCYLEIIGPDLEQEAVRNPRWFNVDTVTAPQLVAWAANAVDLDRAFATARQHGVELGSVKTGGRRRADGVQLNWRFTDPTHVVDGGVVPFLIDWGSGPHPAETAVGGVALVELAMEHPDPDRARKHLRALGLEFVVTSGARPALVATLQASTVTIQIR